MAHKVDPRILNAKVEYVGTKEDTEKAMRALGRFFAERLWNELHGKKEEEPCTH